MSATTPKDGVRRLATFEFGVRGRRVRIDLADAGLATAILAVTLWYFLETRAKSAALENILLLAPAAALLFVLWFAIVVQSAAIVSPGDGSAAPARPRAGARVFGLIAAFALYIAALPALGFDLGSALFTALCLAIQGERRWLLVGAYAAAVGLTLGWAMDAGLPADVPNSLIGLWR